MALRARPGKCLPFLLAVMCLLLALPLSAGQASVHGKVIDEQGAPIVGAVVGTTISCCPPKTNTSKTDGRGQFYLDNHGSILRIRAESFEPQSLVLKNDHLDVQVTLHPELNKLHPPECGRSTRGERLLGWGWGLHFSVPDHGIHVSGGDVDVDYKVYGIRLKRGGRVMELWFGPTAFTAEPDDQQLVKSVEFSQRDIFNSKDEAIGLDSRGHTLDGRLWRRMGLIMSGAKYDGALPEESTVFDRIVDSACFVSRSPIPH